MSATLTTETKIHQSKWGYHPVSHEDFLKLKEAHGLLLRAYRDTKRNKRWCNKDSQNRRGKEPKCPEFMTEYGYHILDERTFYGHGFLRCRDSNGAYQNYYLHILRQYRKARKPVDTPEAVEPLDLPGNFDEIIEKLREFYSE